MAARRLALFAALLPLGALGAEGGGAPNPYVTAYPFASAIVHYRLRTEVGHAGMGTAARQTVQEDEQTLYLQRGRLAKLTRLGKSEALEIYTADKVYALDLNARKGTWIANPKKPGRLAYARLSQSEQAAFHRRLRERGVVSFDLPYLGKKTGTDTIAGQQCDVYQLGAPPTPQTASTSAAAEQDRSMQTCLWAGAIPLRMRWTTFAGSREMLATRIEKDVAIPGRRFLVPKGFTITEDQEKSELERRYALARFALYRSGKPMVLRMKVGEPVPVPAAGASSSGGSPSSNKHPIGGGRPHH